MECVDFVKKKTDTQFKTRKRVLKVLLARGERDRERKTKCVIQF